MHFITCSLRLIAQPVHNSNPRLTQKSKPYLKPLVVVEKRRGLCNNNYRKTTLVAGVGLELPVSLHNRHRIVVSFRSISLFSFLAFFVPEQVWQEMTEMKRKLVNCPHCGKILSEDFLKGVRKKKVKCPRCGSERNCKDGKADWDIQRYLCKDCCTRFSER